MIDFAVDKAVGRKGSYQYRRTISAADGKRLAGRNVDGFRDRGVVDLHIEQITALRARWIGGPGVRSSRQKEEAQELTGI